MRNVWQPANKNKAADKPTEKNRRLNPNSEVASGVPPDVEGLASRRPENKRRMIPALLNIFSRSKFVRFFRQARRHGSTSGETPNATYSTSEFGLKQSFINWLGLESAPNLKLHFRRVQPHSAAGKTTRTINPDPNTKVRIPPANLSKLRYLVLLRFKFILPTRKTSLFGVLKVILPNLKVRFPFPF